MKSVVSGMLWPGDLHQPTRPLKGVEGEDRTRVPPQIPSGTDKEVVFHSSSGLVAIIVRQYQELCTSISVHMFLKLLGLWYTQAMHARIERPLRNPPSPFPPLVSFGSYDIFAPTVPSRVRNSVLILSECLRISLVRFVPQI